MGDGWGGLGHYPGPAEPAEINIDRQVAKRVDQSIKDLYEYANKIYRLDNTNSISYDNIVKNKKKYDGEVFVIWYTDYTYNDRDNKVFRLNYHELRLPEIYVSINRRRVFLNLDTFNKNFVAIHIPFFDRLYLVDGYYDLTPFKTDGVLEKGREYLNELYQMKRNQHLKKHLIENFDQKVLQKMKQMLY